MAKKSSYNPVKSGYDPRKDKQDGPNMWMRLMPNQSADIVILVEIEDIITVEQCAIWIEGGGDDGVKSPVWTYTGPNDPMHELNEVKKSYRAFLPCVENGEVKVLPMGKMLHGALLDIADAAGSIAGMQVRVKRTGSGLNTRYSLVQTGKRMDVSKYDEVDVVALLGPLTPDGVRELIAQRLQLDSYEEVLEKYSGKAVPATRTTKTKKKAAPVVVEEDDEEEDDLLLDDDDDEDEE